VCVCVCLRVCVRVRVRVCVCPCVCRLLPELTSLALDRVRSDEALPGSQVHELMCHPNVLTKPTN